VLIETVWVVVAVALVDVVVLLVEDKLVLEVVVLVDVVAAETKTDTGWSIVPCW